jgi:hypothetical protein
MRLPSLTAEKSFGHPAGWSAGGVKAVSGSGAGGAVRPMATLACLTGCVGSTAYDCFPRCGSDLSCWATCTGGDVSCIAQCFGAVEED